LGNIVIRPRANAAGKPDTAARNRRAPARNLPPGQRVI
jgi:hypothetical protein